jgi:hypothetical protein
VLQTLTEPVFIIHSTGQALPKMAELKRPDEENPKMTSPDNTIPSRARRLPAVFLLCAHITVYSSCAFGPNKNGSIDPTLRRISGNPEIERIPHQVFDLKSIVPTGQQPRVEVRLAKPGEISKAWPASLFEGLATGSAIAAAGVGVAMLVPMAQSSAVVGGAIVLPSFTALGIMNHRQRSVLVRSMDQADFPSKLTSLLQTEITRRFPGKETNSPEVLVLILGYGLLGPAEQEELCFYCDARLLVQKAGKILFEDPIIWHAQKRSDDLPPPRFARLSQFAERDGKLARDTFMEASEVMAAIIAKRLGGRS